MSAVALFFDVDPDLGVGPSKDFRRKLERLILSAEVISTVYQDEHAITIMRVSAPRLNQLFGTDFR